MARRPQFKDEDILQAAREVFLERGVRATTADVAERAGVSEGTLFHHFKSKEALFRAALSPSREEPPELLALLDRVGKGTVAENLATFGTAVIEDLRVQLPAMMLAFYSAQPEERAGLICEYEPAYSRTVRAVAAYLEGEARLDRVRRVDSEIAARAFVGGLSDYVRTELIQMQPKGLPLPVSMFVRGLVDVFIHGVAGSARKPRRAVRRAH